MTSRAVALCLLLAACATGGPPPPPVLPAPLGPAIDVSKLLPPPEAPPPPPPAGIMRHEDLPVDEGQCPGLPPGILLDEATYAEAIRTASDRRRLAAELAATQGVRQTERREAEEIERVLRQEVSDLDRALDKPPSFWERWKFPIGVAVGMAVSTFGVWAATKALR